MAQPPLQVLELVQRFDRNHDAYRSPHYNETQVRREFLDPLFKSLGWDIDNEQGYAEAYKDVVHEDATRYNSGLFHFKPEKDRHEAPDELTLALDIDDKLLRDIIKGLYYPESPYVFSALPADILGQVYEQFLGKVIRLTEGHRAVVEEKPEVKKAGGVYYIRRYLVEDDGRHLIVIPAGWTRRQMAKAKNNVSDYSEREAWNWLSREHPAIAGHLSNFTEPLRKRQDQGDYWWELRSCDYYQYFDAPKIIFPDICKAPRFHLDRSGIYLSNTAYCLGVGDMYLLGILNSRLFWFAISNISIPFGIRAGKYRYRLIYQYMEKIPIRLINAENPADTSRRDQVAQMAEQMLALHQRLSAARTPQEKTSLERQIVATDTQLNKLVYDLYGLSDAEIAIVNQAIE